MPGPQHGIGHRAINNWGEGSVRSEYAVGDVVFVPKGCAAVLDKRCQPGLHRIESVFSIGEDASYYYRVCPTEIVSGRSKYRLEMVTDWDGVVSDRIHVIPGHCDYTAGFIRLYEANKDFKEPEE